MPRRGCKYTGIGKSEKASISYHKWQHLPAAICKDQLQVIGSRCRDQTCCSGLKVQHSPGTVSRPACNICDPDLIALFAFMVVLQWIQPSAEGLGYRAIPPATSVSRAVLPANAFASAEIENCPSQLSPAGEKARVLPRPHLR